MSRGGPATGGLPANGVEVLVVDDNPTNMFVLTAMLRSLGLLTLSAADGIEAVQIATEKLPALIFMDLQMPRMDGVTATRRIRGAGLDPRPAIVAVTAYADVGNLLDFRESRVRRLAGEAHRIVGRSSRRRKMAALHHHGRVIGPTRSKLPKEQGAGQKVPPLLKAPLGSRPERRSLRAASIDDGQVRLSADAEGQRGTLLGGELAGGE